MSYQTEPRAIYPDHQIHAPYGQPITSSPPNYQQPYPQPDYQQQYQQSPQPQQYQQSPPPQQFQQYPSYQEHQYSPAPQPVITPIQPTPQSQMKQNATNHAANSGKPGAWEYGMCGCFASMGKSFKTCLCPCITYGKINHRLGHKDMATYSTCNCHCWGFCALCVCGLQWIISMIQRGEIRRKYHLKGSCIGDCCRHCCCECCTLVQEDRETEKKQALLAPANHAGYQQPAGMQYPQK